MALRIFKHLRHFRYLPTANLVGNVLRRDFNVLSVKMVLLNNNLCSNKQFIVQRNRYDKSQNTKV